MKKTLAWLPVLAAFGVFVGAACSYDIQSPVPTAESLQPDLTCAEKSKVPGVSDHLGTVILNGTNFTPMPAKTLEAGRDAGGCTTEGGCTELILPKIELLQTQALGTATKSITVPDDPAHPEASLVHWTSEKLMSFDVLGGPCSVSADKCPTGSACVSTDPNDMAAQDKGQCVLTSGVYSVKITNPDKKSTVTLKNSLAIIPAPKVATVKPPSICDDQADQKIELDGENFLSYGGGSPTVTVGRACMADSDCPTGITCETAFGTCAEKTYPAVADPTSCKPLMGTFTEKNVALCTSVTITIAKGDFPVTDPIKVNVVVQNPAPADCDSRTTVVQLTINPPPTVTAVKPATVCEGGSQLTIDGKNFQMGATVSIDCMGTSVMASGVTVNADGTQIGATFGAGAVPGMVCDVIVQNPDGCQDRPLPHQQVNVVTGPILFYADPPVVYNGINTRITLFATSITPPLPADAVTMTPAGMTMPITQLMFNQVAGHPNRLEAVVPVNQAPGVYDITLKDNSGCFATLPNAITVTADLTVTLKSLNPPFGDTAQDTAVTIFRDKAAPAPANKPFVVTPRVFLNPSNPTPTDIAQPVESVAFVDADTATAVVPKGTPVHGYDVVLVNPDGSVGVLKDGYREVGSPPPVILTATPSSIVAATGQVVVLAGTNFNAGDVVTLICATGAATLTSAAPVCAGVNCTQTITINGSTLPQGDVCIVRVTNPDGSYGEFSAIGVTNSSLNLSAPQAGTPMNTGRRALSAASGNATPAARFVYAIGGDTGMASGALDTTEFAPVDLFGKFGAWTPSVTPLKSKRTLAGATTVGRYIYLVGGDNGAGPVDTAERALILSPREAPVILDVDLALVDMVGLDQGEYHYRVSATFDPTDTDNPGGESLASDPFTIKLPAFPKKKITVTLVWQHPKDSLGNDIAGVSGYRVYRTAKPGDPPGSEVLFATISGGAVVTFKDDGTAAPGTAGPLPTGSTGEWLSLPTLGTKRSGPAVIAGNDPATPGKFYVYALFGKSAATTAVASYEYLSVTTAPNGRQTVAAAWTNGASASIQPRWQLGAWLVDKTVFAPYSPDTWIFMGGGLDGNNVTVGKVEAGKILAGGDLGAINDTPKDFSSTSAGYGVCGANGQLFLFGGAGASPSSGAKSASIVTPAPGLANNSWNSEGLTMTHGRYLMGSSVQSSFIFLLGGQTDEAAPAGNASKTTELVIW
jgi:hypothetical protein